MGKSMPSPDIRTTVFIEEKDFTLHIMSYRMLTPEEIDTCLAAWLKSNNLTEPPENTEAEMLTLYGADDPVLPPS